MDSEKIAQIQQDVKTIMEHVTAFVKAETERKELENKIARRKEACDIENEKIRKKYQPLYDENNKLIGEINQDFYKDINECRSSERRNELEMRRRKRECEMRQRWREIRDKERAEMHSFYKNYDDDNDWDIRFG